MSLISWSFLPGSTVFSICEDVSLNPTDRPQKLTLNVNPRTILRLQAWLWTFLIWSYAQITKQKTNKIQLNHVRSFLWQRCKYGIYLQLNPNNEIHGWGVGSCQGADSCSTEVQREPHQCLTYISLLLSVSLLSIVYQRCHALTGLWCHHFLPACIWAAFAVAKKKKKKKVWRCLKKKKRRRVKLSISLRLLQSLPSISQCRW